MKHDIENSNTIIPTIKTKKAKKLDKLKDNDLEIPNYSEYKKFNNINYPLSFLKLICKNYKLKRSGNKPELKSRISLFLINSSYCIVIQKNIRGYFLRLDHKLRGKALYNRSQCMNSTDFFTLENVVDIPRNAFFSYKYNDNIWGFDIISIYNLFIKSTDTTINPYTREKLDCNIFTNIKQLVRLSYILNNPVNIVLNKDETNISIKKKIELKCLELFQYIDELGNYTDSKWFISLNRHQLIRFVRELMDIWEFRAQLDMEVKRDICPPHGNPFRSMQISYLITLGCSQLQKAILSIIEQFIKKGITRDLCALGASYILCGLTLVNQDAALAIPWLYQSVAVIA